MTRRGPRPDSEALLLDPGTAEFWNGDRRSNWNYEALGGAVPLVINEHHAHVQPKCVSTCAHRLASTTTVQIFTTIFSVGSTRSEYHFSTYPHSTSKRHDNEHRGLRNPCRMANGGGRTSIAENLAGGRSRDSVVGHPHPARYAEELPFPLLLLKFLGPAAISALILLWWVGVSRAAWWEKLFGLVGVLLDRCGEWRLSTLGSHFIKTGGTGGSTTIRNVAKGPMKTEASHQNSPLRPLAWASPALMRDSVPQPTKKSALFDNSESSLSNSPAESESWVVQILRLVATSAGHRSSVRPRS